MPSDNDNRRDSNWAQALSTVALALAIPSMIAIPALVGWWLDQKFGTSPLWLLVCLFIGLISAAFDVYKMMQKFGQFK